MGRETESRRRNYTVWKTERRRTLPHGWREAQLLMTGDQRVILLKKGVLRSRQLDTSKQANFTIIVDDWLQLDCGPHADFAVEL